MVAASLVLAVVVVAAVVVTAEYSCNGNSINSTATDGGYSVFFMVIINDSTAILTNHVVSYFLYFWLG